MRLFANTFLKWHWHHSAFGERCPEKRSHGEWRPVAIWVGCVVLLRLARHRKIIWGRRYCLLCTVFLVDICLQYKYLFSLDLKSSFLNKNSSLRLNIRLIIILKHFHLSLRSHAAIMVGGASSPGAWRHYSVCRNLGSGLFVDLTLLSLDCTVSFP